MPRKTPESALHQAAAYLASGKTIIETATLCGVDEKTIDRWKHEPRFLSALQKANDEARQHIVSHGAALKEHRILAMRRRLRDLYRIARTRAGRPDRGGAKWDKTGYVTRRDKMLGSGEFAQLTEEFELDTGLLAEIRNIEQAIAQEMGELKKPPATPVRREELSHTAVLLLEMFPTPEELADAKARFLGVVQEKQTVITEE
jgi:hypothetical protein